jgi:hypothetical protein
MKKELFEELLQSVNEAAAIKRGKLKSSRSFEVETGKDIVRVRKSLAVSQTPLQIGRQTPEDCS